MRADEPRAADDQDIYRHSFAKGPQTVRKLFSGDSMQGSADAYRLA